MNRSAGMGSHAATKAFTPGLPSNAAQTLRDAIPENLPPEEQVVAEVAVKKAEALVKITSLSVAIADVGTFGRDFAAYETQAEKVKSALDFVQESCQLVMENTQGDHSNEAVLNAFAGSLFFLDKIMPNLKIFPQAEVNGVATPPDAYVNHINGLGQATLRDCAVPFLQGVFHEATQRHAVGGSVWELIGAVAQGTHVVKDAALQGDLVGDMLQTVGVIGVSVEQGEKLAAAWKAGDRQQTYDHFLAEVREESHAVMQEVLDQNPQASAHEYLTSMIAKVGELDAEPNRSLKEEAQLLYLQGHVTEMAFRRTGDLNASITPSAQALVNGVPIGDVTAVAKDAKGIKRIAEQLLRETGQGEAVYPALESDQPVYNQIQRLFAANPNEYTLFSKMENLVSFMVYQISSAISNPAAEPAPELQRDGVGRS